MSRKDAKSLFKSQKRARPNKSLVSSSFGGISREVESPNYVEAFLKDRDRFKPNIDFSNPANFAKFGSAEEYYKKAIHNIYRTYPYDGSLQEKYSWHNSSSYFDNYFFEYEYPRTNGYITIGAYFNDVGAVAFDATDKFVQSLNPQIISIKGGPHGPTAPTYDPDYDKQITYKDPKQKANIFNLTSSQAQNLTIDGTKGNTVEFWMKLPTEPSKSQTSPSHAYFDLWNEGTSKTSSGTYGRFLIETRLNKTLNGSYVDNSVFHITYMSGNTGAERVPLGPTSLSGAYNIDLTDWNHYAFIAQNNPTGSDHLLFNLYINGNLIDSVHSGSQVSEVKEGPFNANIGSYRYKPASNFTGVDDSGYGALSGSLFDEFRFWKTARNEKDINLNWFTQVAGGTNSDYGSQNSKFSGSSNPVNLGVYYKFNEGITGYSAQDKTILDYSGRVSNGLYENYSTHASSPTIRYVGSALVSASAAEREFKDPIVYNNHPSVVSLMNEKVAEGLEYDNKNSMGVYRLMPQWMLDEDSDKDRFSIRKLTQIVASYFDELYIQTEQLPKIKNHSYISGSVSGSAYKPIPFAGRLLESKGFVAPELFSTADVLPFFANRDNVREYKTELVNVKNQIYTNIYNNLNFINKSKGTEKSIRNLIRCFGVDDDLYALSFYANNADITLNQSITPKIITKNFANFATASNFNALVYQSTASSNSNSAMYITGSNKSAGFDAEIGFTVETDVIFPKELDINNPRKADTEYVPISASLFGMHGATIQPSNEGDTTWADNDYASFQVYAVRDVNSKIESQYNLNQVKFVLTGTNVNSTTVATVPYLTSSFFEDVYEDEKWHFAVKVLPSTYPNLGIVSGTSGYNVEFHGYNTQADIVVNSFVLTGSVSSGNEFLASKKRLYVGSHRTNYTGSLIVGTNTKISSCRYWALPLEKDEIISHAIDASNYGLFDPMESAYLFQNYKVNVPKIRTLALNWDFNTVTGSDASGEFVVQDFSSGSADSKFRGDLSDLLLKQHTGRGLYFYPSSTDAISKQHVYSYKQQVPENLDVSDTVKILTRDQEFFSPRTRPTKFSFAVEKSMYQAISEQMLNFLACSAEASGLENLIGDPINKYRPNYKLLTKIREIFFERIGNTPDLDKYLEYFKWLDSSVSQMVNQLVPASSQIEGVKNIVESHVFERSKYAHKFPTMEFGSNDPTGSIRGINELLYDWQHGHAPLSLSQTDNCNWWNKKASRGESFLETGVASVDADRKMIHSASLQVFNRRFGSPYNITAKEGGGPLKTKYNKRSIVMAETRPFTNRTITYDTTTFTTSSILCADDIKINPNIKRSADYQVQLNDATNTQSKYSNALVSPYTFFSSSVTTAATGVPTGYQAGPDHLRDYYLDTKEVPAQGPFTRQHVGGNQYRNIGYVWKPVQLSGPTEPRKDQRPEAWYAVPTFAGGNIYYNILNPSYFGSTFTRSDFTRDFIAKSPVNIKNIKTTTATLSSSYGSIVSMGNYAHNYEIVQIPDRSINNRYLVENNGIPTASVASTSVFGLKDYVVPDRGRHASIMVSRFSAPGGPEVNSSGYLDYESETFSVYNALPFRNLAVRSPLRTLLTKHTAFGGYDSVLGEPSASYQKTQRNGAKRIELSAAGIYSTAESVVTASVYDNYWVQHMVPQSDLQYAWITASALTAPFGYSQPNANNASEASSDISFVLTSDTNSFLIYADQGVSNLSFLSDTISNYDNQTVAFRSTMGTLKTYKFTDDSGEGSTGAIHSDGSSIVVQINGMSSKDAYAAQLQAAINSANGHNGGLPNSVVTAGYGSSNMAIVQIVPGPLASTVLSTPTWSGAGSTIGVTTFSAAGAPTDRRHRMFSTSPGGSVYNSSSANLDPTKIPVSFVGLNTHFVDTFSPYTNIIFDTSLNTTFIAGGALFDAPIFNSADGSIGTGSFLNAMNLRRNGPGGFSSWKQVRQSENPIVRYHNKNNFISLMTQSVVKYADDGSILREKNLVSFRDPAVISSYKPLVHKFTLKNGEEVVVKSTYGNNLHTFNNKVINEIIGFEAKRGEEVYDDLKRIYIDKDLGDFSPINTFKSLTYGEIVFPKKNQMGLSRTRGRENYTVSSGSSNFNLRLGDSTAFWKDNIDSRIRSEGVAKNAEGITIFSGSGPIGMIDLSIWPLDAEEPFFDYYLQSASAGVVANEEGFDPYFWAPLGPSGAQLNPSVEPRWNNVNKNGELSYAGWVYGLYNSMELGGKNPYLTAGTRNGAVADIGSATALGIKVSASIQYEYPNLIWSGSFPYGRRPDNAFNENAGTANLGFIINHASASLHLIPPYRADVLSGRTPWYDSYEEYSKDIRLMGKNHSILPEFKISDHMDYYVNNGFSSENNKFLDLIGASLDTTGSATSETASFQNQFFTIYSNSDFMSKFVELKEDHKKNSTAGPTKISLKVNAIKKLLPYQGFYPALRSVQLGHLFSSSYSPYISGSTAATEAQAPQGRLAALYQPFFAPGIFFNTIKSGIAVDYSVHTGSLPSNLAEMGGRTGNAIADIIGVDTLHSASNTPLNIIVNEPNYSFPFEAIINPDRYLPITASNNYRTAGEVQNTVGYASGSVFLVYPHFTGSFNTGQAGTRRGEPWQAGALSSVPKPNYFFNWKGQSDIRYSLAANNFFAEVEEFFLERKAPTSFISKAEKDFRSMVSGSVYIMDVVLSKTQDYVSYEGPSGSFEYYPFTGSSGLASQSDPSNKLGRGRSGNPKVSVRGMHYGPPYLAQPKYFGNTVNESAFFEDPCYAIHTPPYFYGDAVARIEVRPHEIEDMVEGSSRKFELRDILANAKVFTRYFNTNERAQDLLVPSNYTLPVARNQMQISSSVDLFGSLTLKQVNYSSQTDEDGNFIPEGVSTTVLQDSQDAWVIESKFECPSINMHDMDVASLGAGPNGNEKYYTRGVWKGFGNPPTGSDGIYLAIRESAPQRVESSKILNAAGNASLTGSLINVCGFESDKVRVGEIASRKEISEAIVAVPINSNGEFYSIDEGMFLQQLINIDNGDPAIKKDQFGAGTDIKETSISGMIKKMKKFYIPPQLDPIKNANAKPVVMYIFEFNHTLDKKDLSYIWQNLMPDIAMTAEKDHSVIEHNLRSKFEFFGNEAYTTSPFLSTTSDIRWMVFKVKQRGRNNYNNVTKKSERGQGFPFTSNKELAAFTSSPDKELNYSYNWPYDFFSLVELAQLETSFVLSPATEEVAPATGQASEFVQQNVIQQGLGAATQGTQSPPEVKPRTTVDIDDAELTRF